MHRRIIKNEMIKLFDSVKDKHVPRVSEVLDTMKTRSVLIYGAGSFGKEIFGVLSERGINVYAFLDVKAERGDALFGIPVYKADDPSLGSKLKSEALVVFSIVIGKNSRELITDYIKGCGFNSIINGQSIRARLVRAENYPNEIIGLDYLNPRKDDILNCVDCWADDESANIYKANMYAHVLRNYDLCLESEGDTQYFLNDLKFHKGFSRFVDCGGYIGDTLLELIRTQGKIKAIVSFEPNNESFMQLSQAADSLREDIEELYLFPCGVSVKTEMLPFMPMGGSSSITNNSEFYIQCVALDDVLKGFEPTFIKLDVEGAEYRALLGAQRMIKAYKPDLAVCLYHNINHLWEIPLLLKKWNLGYKFYLRAHNACTMETVMYATSEEV